MTMVWKAGKKGVEEDKAANLKNYYNAFSKDLTIDTKKGPRTRKVSLLQTSLVCRTQRMVCGRGGLVRSCQTSLECRTQSAKGGQRALMHCTGPGSEAQIPYRTVSADAVRALKE